MKKIIQFLILCIMLSSTVFAASFEEINMTINLPEEYYDLKEAIDNEDTKITYYETLLRTTKEELKKEIKQNNILYYGKNNDLSKTLMISMMENDLSKKIFQLHLASNAEISRLKEDLTEEAVSNQISIKEINVYEKNDIKWLETVIETKNETMQQYYTIINGKAITISLDEKDAEEKEEELKNIVDTVKFYDLKEKAPDFTNYILIGVTALMVIVVVILIVLVFSKGKEQN